MDCTGCDARGAVLHTHVKFFFFLASQPNEEGKTALPFPPSLCCVLSLSLSLKMMRIVFR